MTSLPNALAAQVEVEAILDGSVHRGGSGVAGVPVTLHRVGQDTAGVLGVEPSGPAGAFRFRLPRLPNPAIAGEVYFASVEYQGIMYFGPAISTPADLDSVYVIEVHDTTQVPDGAAPLVIQTRTVVLEQMEEGWSVTDLFEIRNETSNTFVSGPTGSVWSYPLPSGATGFELGESDLAADAVDFSGGGVSTSAPIPPGARLYLFRYRIPDWDFDIPQRGSERFELLLREPARTVSVDGLRAEAPITPDQGVTYRRFAGLDIAPSAINVREATEDRGVPLAGVTVVLGMALALLGLWVFRRGDGSAEDRRARIVLNIARLDEAFHGQANPTAEDQARYRRRREALAAKLKQQG